MCAEPFCRLESQKRGAASLSPDRCVRMQFPKVACAMGRLASQYLLSRCSGMSPSPSWGGVKGPSGCRVFEVNGAVSAAREAPPFDRSRSGLWGHPTRPALTAEDPAPSLPAPPPCDGFGEHRCPRRGPHRRGPLAQTALCSGFKARRWCAAVFRSDASRGLNDGCEGVRRARFTDGLGRPHAPVLRAPRPGQASRRRRRCPVRRAAQRGRSARGKQGQKKGVLVYFCQPAPSTFEAGRFGGKRRQSMLLAGRRGRCSPCPTRF